MLIPISSDHYDVDLDLRYAVADNVAGRALYRRSACLLNRDAAQALDRAIALARPLGLRLRIFDGFRPIEAQRALVRRFPDSPFVSDPRTGSAPHCRGAAVDLTLSTMEGDMLEMGTGFDDFTAAAHHGCTAISVEAQRNRAVLLGLMSTAGWDFYAKEWWHYQLFAPRRYPLLSDSILDQPLVAEGL